MCGWNCRGGIDNERVRYMEQLLIIEDDIGLNQGLSKALKADDRQIISCYNLSGAREQLLCGSVSLILLDINLPDGNGLDFLKEIKEKAPDIRNNCRQRKTALCRRKGRGLNVSLTPGGERHSQRLCGSALFLQQCIQIQSASVPGAKNRLKFAAINLKTSPTGVGRTPFSL